MVWDADGTFERELDDLFADAEPEPEIEPPAQATEPEIDNFF